MNLRARRIFYLSAFSVFLLVGPFVVAWTAGFRWGGWRSGFLPTGALLITSEPKAALAVDQKHVGLTPQRLSHLPPGIHSLELQAEGKSPWRQLVNIQPKLAAVVGPVYLYPPFFQQTTQDIEAVTPIVAADGGTIFSVVSRDGRSEVSESWPNRRPIAALPFIPTAVELTDSQRLAIFSSGPHAAVVDHGQKSEPWLIETPTAIQWDANTESTFYGLKAGRLVRFDALLRTATELSVATSFTTDGSILWSTQISAGSTTLLRQHSFGQTVPDVVAQLIGVWEFVPGPSRTLLIRQTSTRELQELNLDPITNQVTATTFGPADVWWWSDRNQLPIWAHGADLFTRDDRGQPLLIDRLDRTPEQARWVVPGHILLLFDGDILSISSVSSRQGRGSLVSQPDLGQWQWLKANLDRRTVTMVTRQSPFQTTSLSW